MGVQPQGNPQQPQQRHYRRGPPRARYPALPHPTLGDGVGGDHTDQHVEEGQYGQQMAIAEVDVGGQSDGEVADGGDEKRGQVENGGWRVAGGGWRVARGKWRVMSNGRGQWRWVGALSKNTLGYAKKRKEQQQQDRQRRLDQEGHREVVPPARIGVAPQQERRRAHLQPPADVEQLIEIVRQRHGPPAQIAQQRQRRVEQPHLEAVGRPQGQQGRCRIDHKQLRQQPPVNRPPPQPQRHDDNQREQRHKEQCGELGVLQQSQTHPGQQRRRPRRPPQEAPQGEAGHSRPGRQPQVGRHQPRVGQHVGIERHQPQRQQPGPVRRPPQPPAGGHLRRPAPDHGRQQQPQPDRRHAGQEHRPPYVVADPPQE